MNILSPAAKSARLNTHFALTFDIFLYTVVIFVLLSYEYSKDCKVETMYDLIVCQSNYELTELKLSITSSTASATAKALHQSWIFVLVFGES